MLRPPLGLQCYGPLHTKFLTVSLAGLSASRLYNLRKSRAYQRQRAVHTSTKPSVAVLGERRRPRPEGRPGFVRVDPVHQGDLDGRKGVYESNLVDEVTQYEFVGAVEAISERFLRRSRTLPQKPTTIGDIPRQEPAV